jgi:hypothetical protein
MNMWCKSQSKSPASRAVIGWLFIAFMAYLTLDAKLVAAQTAEAAAPKEEPTEALTEEAQSSELSSFSEAKVYTCAIDFPLDSVQFNEQRMEDCFAGVDRQRMSYVHVIATATVTGSNDHNLYLSNRRAGAIEGYLKNRFPEVTIHAFGGGKNPKFGKSARIFIVESPENPDQESLEQKVVVEKYPEVRVEVKTEYKYLEPVKLGLGVHVLGGVSAFRGQTDSPYQYAGLGVQYDTYLPYLDALGEFGLGLRYTLNRSNKVLDIHEGALTVEKMFPLNLNLQHGRLGAGFQAHLGGSMQDEIDPNVGGLGLLRYTVKDYSSAVHLGYSKHFRWVGVEMGVLL